jgi:AraC-like DNA-binding protein
MHKPSEHATGFAAPLVRVVSDYVAAQGLDTALILNALQLHPEQLDDMAHRVPSARLAEALRLACRLCGDDNAPIRIAQMLRPAHLGTLGYALISSPSVSEALALFDRMQRLLCNEMRVDNLLKTDTLEMRCELLSPMPRDTHLWSFISCARLSFSRWVLGRHLAPVRIDLPCPAPLDPTLLLANLDCPVQFDAAQARVVVPLDWLMLHNPNADPQLHRMMSSMADQAWTQQQASSDEIITRLKQLITQRLQSGQTPSLEALLPDLHTTGFQSARQLQRRLADQQLSYKTLVEDIRKEQVLNDLRHTDLPLCEVAQRAAYAETASFHRAVKRWTGITPMAWRLQSKKSPKSSGA